MHTTEEQVPTVHDVRLLEKDDSVAAGVPGSEIARVDGLTAEVDVPRVLEGDIGKCLLRRVAGLLRDLLVPRDAVVVRDDPLDDRLERRVSTGVIGVVVRVDEQLDPWVLSA
jgi:hypothetical protein